MVTDRRFPEVQWWNTTKERLNSLKELYPAASTSETIGRVNRGIASWPSDDTMAIEKYEEIKNIYKKLSSGLRDVKESADSEIGYV
jgi:SAGA-associated factor 29